MEIYIYIDIQIYGQIKGLKRRFVPSLKKKRGYRNIKRWVDKWKYIYILIYRYMDR